MEEEKTIEIAWESLSKKQLVGFIKNRMVPEFRQLESLLKKRTEVAEILYGLLDDIDTAEDMFKPEITPHFKYVNKKHQERHKYINTDGYELSWPKKTS